MKKLVTLLLVICLAAIALVSAQAEEFLTYADTIAWDGAYDVIVAGYGAAGASAAKTAADEGAQVLLLEKAPEGHEGGNSRVCGQMFITGNGNKEAIRAYYDALNGKYDIPEAIYEAFIDGVAELPEIIARDFGGNRSLMGEKPSYLSPEYPEYPGSDQIELWILGSDDHNGRIYNLLQANVNDRQNNIDIWYESPAVSLIQDPISKAIIGVRAMHHGELVNIRANNGVVLTTGGFENNADMIETYLGLAESSAFGGLYNTGDGIRMAMEVGADLWHMSSYVAGGTGFALESLVENTGNLSYYVLYLAAASPNSYIVVGGDGSRFTREDELLRHGHRYYKGSWKTIAYPDSIYAVMDEAAFEMLRGNASITEIVEKRYIQAETLEALSEATGMNAEILTQTIQNFNAYVENGKDLEYGRSVTTMKSFGEGPYYALPLVACIGNTQGGPKRNENAEILDVNGNPIPHLYSAGELGAIFSNQYQGGGNIAECILFGQIAGRNAASAKDPLPAYTPVRAESNLIYMPNAESAQVEDEIELLANEYLGSTQNGMGGEITVKVTVIDGKITAIDILKQAETVGIGTPALDKLPSAIIEAQSTEVDYVSGATITSKALIEAINSALSQVK